MGGFSGLYLWDLFRCILFKKSLIPISETHKTTGIYILHTQKMNILPFTTNKSYIQQQKKFHSIWEYFEELDKEICKCKEVTTYIICSLCRGYDYVFMLCFFWKKFDYKCLSTYPIFSFKLFPSFVLSPVLCGKICANYGF